MTAVEVLQTLQARDIQLVVEGDLLRWDAPEDAITDEVLTLLRQHKQALLAWLQQEPPPRATPGTLGAAAPSPRPVLAASILGAPSCVQNLQLPTMAWECFCCQGTRRWRSIYGVLICGQCHPPAEAVLVAAWEEVREEDGHDE